MSDACNGSGRATARYNVNENSLGSSAMQTPIASRGTTVFLREEGGTTFMPVFHQSSVTLRDLAEEFNVSSVLECDAHGNVQPRAVAFDSPSDVLHSGRHYIARRDAKLETGSSYVTFKGKIFVKEYELEHPTPPAARVGKTVNVVTADASAENGAEQGRRKPAVTPFVDKRRQRDASEGDEEHSATPEAEGSTPQLQWADENDEEETTISRALALSSERKRPRAESPTKAEESASVAPRNRGAVGAASEASSGQSVERVNNVLSFDSPQPKVGGVLQDRTNSSAASPTAGSKAQSSNEQTTSESAVAAPASELEAENPSCAPAAPPPHASLRFIPFTETAADGTETYVTLESLQQMCRELAAQESEFQKKHRDATDILEGARRVLFLNDGSE